MRHFFLEYELFSSLSLKRIWKGRKMRLATVWDGSRDGRLVVVSVDNRRAVFADGIADTMQDALERWDEVESSLRQLSARLGGSEPGVGFEFSNDKPMAPLPRAWQWLDGSAYVSHGKLMATVLGIEPSAATQLLMYQGMSDSFYGARDDVFLPSVADGIDFEGEFGIIVDHVPMGVSIEDAAKHIRLIVQINDWSLRALAGPEKKTGFGFIQSKPRSAIAPVAVTIDELGTAWRDNRVALPLVVELNGNRFGSPEGGVMAFSFADLIVHATRSRSLVAGTIIGSGTISNDNYREVGSTCIAERRGIEILDHGEPKTPFMQFGDRVRMEAHDLEGRSLFGAIDQRVVKG
jgi:fumarylacetoacetate (FAA) hydrolase